MTAPRPRRTEKPDDRRIVPLDQAPLRRDAERECRRAMRAAAKLREEIENFERQLVPAYERWMQEHFGALLKEEQDSETRIAELEDLVTEVTSAQFWSGGSAHTAYQRVMNEKRREERAAKKGSEDGVGGPDEEGAYSPEEQMFRDFVRNVLGENPDRLPKTEYKSLFREFLKQRGQTEETSAFNGDHIPEKKEHPVRVKELYRLLVRRLHPDSGADYNGEAPKLWHDLQEAYQQDDLERLEILLAMTEIHDSSAPAKATLFHLKQVTSEFLKTEKSLRSKLTRLRRTPAGLLAGCKDLAAFAEKTRAKIQRRLTAARSHLRQLEDLVNSWKVKPQPSGDSPTRRGSSRRGAARSRSA